MSIFCQFMTFLSHVIDCYAYMPQASLLVTVLYSYLEIDFYTNYPMIAFIDFLVIQYFFVCLDILCHVMSRYDVIMT